MHLDDKKKLVRNTHTHTLIRKKQNEFKLKTYSWEVSIRVAFQGDDTTVPS